LCARIQGKWEGYLPLVEFLYNNNYQSTIKMASFEAYMEADVNSIVLEWLRWGIDIGPRVDSKKYWNNKEYSRAYLNNPEPTKKLCWQRRRPLNFQVGVKVFLKVSSSKAIKGLKCEAVESKIYWTIQSYRKVESYCLSNGPAYRIRACT